MYYKGHDFNEKTGFKTLRAAIERTCDFRSCADEFLLQDGIGWKSWDSLQNGDALDDIASCLIVVAFWILN